MRGRGKSIQCGGCRWFNGGAGVNAVFLGLVQGKRPGDSNTGVCMVEGPGVSADDRLTWLEGSTYADPGEGCQ